MGICCVVFILATSNSTYFYNSNGQLLSFNDADIDSIAFSKVDTNGIEQENVVTQIIYAGDSTYRISIAQVDSIALTPRTTQNDEYGITIGQEVDLGLPSGTIWAGWNVGATSPEESGGYYAWGETEEKTNYSYETYKFWEDIDGDGDLNLINEYTFIGYNISGTQYDVARKKWGGSWRMPTKEEFNELISKCIWVWIQYKGINGYKITGINGNSIFLPAVGGKYKIDSYLKDSGGVYSTATSADGEYGGNYDIWYLYFGNNDYFCQKRYTRYDGRPVRPVK